MRVALAVESANNDEHKWSFEGMYVDRATAKRLISKAFSKRYKVKWFEEGRNYKDYPYELNSFVGSFSNYVEDFNDRLFALVTPKPGFESFGSFYIFVGEYEVKQ